MIFVIALRIHIAVPLSKYPSSQAQVVEFSVLKLLAEQLSQLVEDVPQLAQV
jgi:hypothetical protein